MVISLQQKQQQQQQKNATKKPMISATVALRMVILVLVVATMIRWVHFESSFNSILNNGNYNNDNNNDNNDSKNNSSRFELSDDPTHREPTIKSTTSTTTTTSSSKSNIVIDILSIASNQRNEYWQAQRDTFGSSSRHSHSNNNTNNNNNNNVVRHFIHSTEVDDAQPNCSTTRKINDLRTQIDTCRTKHSQTAFLQQYKFFVPRWILKKPNPVGWMCAQVRPGSGLGKVGRFYDNNNDNNKKNNNSLQVLPDFLWVIDDDTLLQMDMFVHHVTTMNIDPSIPMVWAGCLTAIPINNYMRYSPFGGAGTVWSRGAIERLLQPIHCDTNDNDNDNNNNNNNEHDKEDDNDDSSSSSFIRRVCHRIQENLILERDLFQNGMTMYQFMETVFHQEPNCFHSDWLLGHFIEYYYLSEPIWNDPAVEEEVVITTQPQQHKQQHKQQQQKSHNTARLHPLIANESMQYFYKVTTPSLPIPTMGRLCEYTSIKPQTNVTCHKDLMICHYVSPDRMRQVASEWMT